MIKQTRDPEHAGRNRQWLAHMKALAQSGLSRAEYCRQHGLSYHALTYWQRKLGKNKANAPSSALVPVTLQSQLERQCRATDRPELHIVLQGELAIAVGDNFSAGTFKRLLAILESR